MHATLKAPTAMSDSLYTGGGIINKNNEIKSWYQSQLEQNLDSLFSLARRLTGNTADAEDLVAETAIKAWSALDSLNDRTRFRAWIFRILHNRFISDYRKQTVRPREYAYDEHDSTEQYQEISELLIQQPDEFLNWWANPEHQVINKMLGRDIMQAIENLPEAYRITVLLINVEGLSYDEAADVLCVSPGTIRSRMNRGRTLLQKALWQQASEAGLIDSQGLAERIHE